MKIRKGTVATQSSIKSRFKVMSGVSLVTMASLLMGLSTTIPTASASTTEWYNSHNQIDSFNDGTTTWSLTSTANLEVWGSVNTSYNELTISEEDISITIHGGASSPYEPTLDPWTSTVNYYANGSQELSDDPTGTPSSTIVQPGDVEVEHVDYPGTSVGPIPSYAQGTTGYYAENCYPMSFVNPVNVSGF